MNKIKFRAWSVENNKMIQVWQLEFFENNEIIINESLPMKFQDKKLYFLMQFTGLYDKNGKEIYEGDIIKHNGNLISEIKYDEEDCEYKLFNKTMGKMNINKAYFSKYVKVIGNIYKNKNLIK